MIVHVLYFQVSEQNVFSQSALQAFSTLLGSRSKRFSRQASKEGLVAYLKTSLQKVCLSCLGTLLVLCLLLDCIHAGVADVFKVYLTDERITLILKANQSF